MSRTPTTPIAKARARANMTQGVLAQRAGISAHYMSLIDRGLTPPAELRAGLAGVLGVPESGLWPGAARAEGQAAAADQARADQAAREGQVSEVRPFAPLPNFEAVE